MLEAKLTEDWGCKFENVWELQRPCYTEFDENEVAEKLFYLCKKLAALQKSNAVFQICVNIFITLLHRGSGNINIAHHNYFFQGVLGSFNAQCQRLNALKLHTLYLRVLT